MPAPPERRPARATIAAAVLGAAVAMGTGAILLKTTRDAAGPEAPASASPRELEDLVERTLDGGDLDAARKTGMKLRALGEPSLAVVPRLREALGDADGNRRAAAAILLGRLGAAGTDAIPELTKALGDGDTTVRQESALALGYMGPRAKSAVGALAGMLADPAQPVRLAAVSALGEMGPAAAGALEALQRVASSDPDALVRVFAAAAIKKIGLTPASPASGDRV